MATATNFDTIKNTLLMIPDVKDAPNNIYTFLHVFSQIAINILNNDFSLESIKKITLPDGDVAFDDDSANEIHSLFQNSGKTLKNAMELIRFDLEHVQRGGGAADKGAVLGALMDVKDKIDLDILSMDGLYYKITNFLDKLDEQNRTLSQQMGVAKFINSAPEDPTARIPTPAGVPIVLKAPIRIFPVFINGVIELLRLGIALDKIPAPDFVNKLLGFSQAFLDVARGRWKYGVLSLLGTMNKKMYFVALILKLIRDAWTLVEPNLSRQLRLQMFMSGKSMVIGFFLRIFSIVAPDFIRKSFDSMLKPVNDLYDRLNEQLEKLEEEANKSANPEGMIVQFPRIAATGRITLDDIQALQTVFSIPEIACTSEVQAIVKSSRVIPPLRFIFELMNIPIADQAVAERCRSLADQPLTSTLVKMLQPKVSLIPGGPMNVAERKEDAAGDAEGIAGAEETAKKMDADAESYEKGLNDKPGGMLSGLGGLAKSMAGNKLKGVPGASGLGGLAAAASGKGGLPNLSSLMK